MTPTLNTSQKAFPGPFFLKSLRYLHFGEKSADQIEAATKAPDVSGSGSWLLSALTGASVRGSESGSGSS